MTKRPHIHIPTDDEDAAIKAGIEKDPDTREFTAAEIAAMKPARGVRGPQKAPKKIPVTMRLDAAVVDAFKATGKGWQSRINDILAAAIKHRA